MTRDVTKLNFYSGDPIDKVVATGTVSYVNSGDTTGSGTGTGYDTSKIQVDTIPNPYKKACFCRYVWSLDGTNFNSGETRLTYSYTSTITDQHATSPPQPGLEGAVSVGVDGTTVYFVTANGLHGNVSALFSDPTTVGYVPTAQVFTIKYALFEIQ